MNRPMKTTKNGIIDRLILLVLKPGKGYPCSLIPAKRGNSARGVARMPYKEVKKYLIGSDFFAILDVVISIEEFYED